MVRIRSNAKQGPPPPARESKRKRKLDGGESAVQNGTSSGPKQEVQLRSSKRSRTAIQPYQAPRSIDAITKLIVGKKEKKPAVEKTPKSKIKRATAKSPAAGKGLKRVKQQISAKASIAKITKPSMRRKILTSTKPVAVQKPKRSRPLVAQEAKSAKKGASKSKTSKSSPVAPKRQRTKAIINGLPTKKKKASAALLPKGKEKVSPKKIKGKLNPKPELPNYEVDPTFESKLEVPFVSTLAHSRLLIRAVILNDMKLLKKLINDEPEKIYTVLMRRSFQNPENVIDYIMKHENKEAFKLLHKLPEKTLKKFGSCPTLLLSKEQTGYGSNMMFGHALRLVSVGRGGKEGNNAFMYDSSNSYNISASGDFRGTEIIKKAIEMGTSKQFLDFLTDLLSVHSWDFSDIHVPLRQGHYELAGVAISKANQNGGFGFNFLHEEVLTKTKASDLTSFKPVSVIKKSMYGPRFTPLHCAAINPNVEILTALLRSVPDFSLADQTGWTVGHYAAVCVGPEPLKYLLQFGISTQAVTSTKRGGDGYTLLHAAVSAGRAQNVKVILEHEEKQARENPSPMDEDEDTPQGKKKASKTLLQNDIKYKLNTRGQNALHMACALGHLEIVKILLEIGNMDANIPTPAKSDRVTPLMIAAMYGHLSIVKTLVEVGVKLEAKDKRGRVAAHYAGLNGHAHVLSYLLRLGVNHLAVDTSGNTILHYSAAYGWYFNTMLCLEAGCPPNATNAWKMTPMAIAFMKGHTGLVTVLIKCEGVDVNARIDDSSGRTLLLDTCTAGYELERMKFLIEDLKADPLCEDFNGNNALHLLAGNEPSNRYDQEKQKKELKAFHSCISYLVGKGCDPRKKNLQGASPMLLAAHKSHFHFIVKLLELDAKISIEQDAENNTLLHYIAAQFFHPENIVQSIFNTLSNNPKNTSVLKEMCKTYNASGLTPLLTFLQKFGNASDASMQEKIKTFLDTLLGKFDADVDAQVKSEKSKKTALHMTVGTNFLPTILKYKPSLDIADADLKTPLVIAVLGGHQESAEQLIDAGANVNYSFQSEHQVSLLLYSVMKEVKSFYLVPKLIAKGANPKEVHPETKNSILHYIARKPTLSHSVQALQAVLDAGTNPNLANVDGRTPLHLVVNARGSDTDVFHDIEDALISAGASLSIKDSRGRTPLHYAFVKIGNPIDSSFFDPIELVSHLVTAMKSSGATQDIHSPDVFGSTALHYSAFRGATICSSYLTQTIPSLGSVDICDNNGNTPFGLAVRNKHEGCALNFFQKDANFLCVINNNIKIEEVQTETAVVSKSARPSKGPPRIPWKWEVMEKEAEEKDRLNEELQMYPILEQVVRHDWQGLLYLMIGHLQSSGTGFSTGIATALKTRRFKLAFKLVLKVKKRQELSLESGTLFHTLAKYYEGGDVELVEKICDRFRKMGLDATMPDEFDTQPVIYALINKQTELCSILLEKKEVMKKLANMKPDLFGRTPYTALFWNIDQLLTSAGVETYAEQMIVAGANPNQLCEFPIELTSYAGARYIKKLAKVTPSNGARYPALIIAVIRQCYTTVKRMLTRNTPGPHQININVQDSEGRTALMHAVRMNDWKMVKLLLDPAHYDVSKDVEGKKEIKVRSSTVNVQVTDQKGWTVMDHLILSPGNNAVHKNVEPVIRLLHQVGALSATSSDGKKPIERAAQCGRKDLVGLIANLTNVPPSKRPQVQDYAFPLSSVLPSQDITLSSISNFAESAQSMADKLMEKELQKLKEKGEDDIMKLKPDPLCGLDESNAEVMIDATQDMPFDCLMTKVDLNYGVHGLYNFYKMQLIKQPRGKQMILLFTQWGRVGQEGQYQKTPFATEEEAVKEFTKIFRAKSGNAWEDVKNFVPIPMKYRLVKKDLRKVKNSTSCSEVKFEELEKYAWDKKSAVPGSTLWLIRNLSMVHKNASQNYEKRYSYNRFASQPSFDNLPLLPMDVLIKGEEILKQIGEKIKLKEEMDNDSKGKYVEKDKVEVMSDMAKLSESFYEIIPVYGYSTEKLEPIFTDHDLRDKLKSIGNLIHLELAKSLLLASQYHQETVNPWEYIYRCLDSRIQLLDRQKDADRLESNIVLQYIKNTGENVKVMGIYRVEREGENERLRACGVSNRQLLWHGTSAANMLSILKHGLQIAPLGSQISGHLFGKGIYLADCFKKSQGYCRSMEVDRTKRKFILLCEAALGKIYEVDLDEAGEKPMPSGCNSLKSAKSKYEPDPESTVIWKGRTVALGKEKEKFHPEDEYYYGLDYNEYIIFNVDQVAVRYLVEFEE